jgi:hypothetical protein
MERIPRLGYNLYSFALFPLLNQPTGAANLSKMDTVRLQPWFHPDVGTGNPIELINIDLNMNIYRVMSGQAGCAFEYIYSNSKN